MLLFTSLTALFSCGIHLTEFVFLLTKEKFIWNQEQEANWQPNVWPFCFKNTGVTNKRNFFSILNEDEWIMICSILLQTKQIDHQWFLQLFSCNFFLQQTDKWMQQMNFASFLKSKRRSNYYLADVKRVVCSRQGLTTNLSGSG